MEPLALHLQFSVSSFSSASSSTSSSSSLHALLFKSPSLHTIPKPQLNPTKTFRFSFSTPKVTVQRIRCNLVPDFQTSNSDSDTDLNPTLEKQHQRQQEAREAVREYLEELGASGEEASYISCNCATYVNMLIDGVHDLDDWNSLAANSNEEIATVTGSASGIMDDAREFKNKVYQMALQKGDKGILPLLESLGLSLSSATHLARYVSSPSVANVLPNLIRQVKYVREIFFSDRDDDDGLIGKNARRMMACLSISADEDVQQTLAFFEKVQARRGGLNLLGSEHVSLRHLIESFPRLLSRPLESRANLILKFLEDSGVPQRYLRNVLLLFPPILLYDFDKYIKPRLQLYEKVGAHGNSLGKMLIKYPWILSASILDNFERIIHFLDEEKVPRICSSTAIKNWPHLLGCSIDRMKVMVEQLEEMGITNKRLGQVIAKSPQLLLRKPQEFVQIVSFFKDLLVDEEAIAKTVARCPEIFAASIDKTLNKKLQFLSSIGISKVHLARVIRKYPELFVCDVDRALLPRVRYLMKIGLSKKDVGFMVRRFSPLLGYSIEEVLRPKMEFLLNTMDRPLRDVVDYPRYFSYSLEKKIKPRYWVMKNRNIDFSLQEMLGKNDEEFAAEYLGVEEVPVPPS